MAYTYTDKKRLRKDFRRLDESMELHDLLAIQRESYRQFLQADVIPSRRKEIGLQAAFQSVFPMENASQTAYLTFVSYRFEEPNLDIQDCITRSSTYAAPMHMTIQLVIYSRETSEIKSVTEQEVYVGEMPLMTDTGSFIINGTERVVVSQLHRSPGVLFSHDKGKGHASGRLLYNARVISYRGSWLDFEFGYESKEQKEYLYVRIDRRKKLPITQFLRSLFYVDGVERTDEVILRTFFDTNQFKISKSKKITWKCIPERLIGERPTFDIAGPDGLIAETGELITQRHVREMQALTRKDIEVNREFLVGQTIVSDITDPASGEILVACNTVMSDEDVERILEASIKKIETIYTNDLTQGSYIADTLRKDDASTIRSVYEIYGVMRPGEPMTEETASQLFRTLFFETDRYDLSHVGRMKFNKRLQTSQNAKSNILHPNDVILVIKTLIDIRNGHGSVDDVDNLGNRRVRSVGEMVENQFRMGLVRVERAVRDRLSVAESDGLMPQDIINTKPIAAAIREFFGSHPLSQIMDHNNPLSEVTNKRRVSALGPGGLTREHAGFEVRDVHPTHYGRLCPIETPEGPTIGLINSIATYARINSYGFIETPYRKVTDGRVTKTIQYISAIDEGKYRIAQASSRVNEDGEFIDEIVDVRFNNEFTKASAHDVEYMDVAPKQIVSISAALIPFLEHDEANRGLMGSNMQRQAVPTICAQAPLVGTGIERQVARDSGACVTATRGGIVELVDAGRVVVRTTAASTGKDNGGIDIYNLQKFTRSNQDTCINHRPIVNPGDRVATGDILADGAAVDIGELALGQNMRIAFMVWNGYNYEDSILVSERVVREDRFTSVHIKVLECTALETKIGPEEITADIPHAPEGALNTLDQDGIVYIGAEVSAGDYLVGKVTPKGENQLTPEQKLLRAIFAEKAPDVKDTSLRVKSDVQGTVVDVRVFTRDGLEKDERTKSILEDELNSIKQDLDDQFRIYERATHEQLINVVKGKTVKQAPDLEPGEKVTVAYLRKLHYSDWRKIRFEEDSFNRRMEEAFTRIDEREKHRDAQYERERNKLNRSDDLPPGVIKYVRVYIATKRRIQAGDKLAGRHGNKGVISVVMPVEDMPYDEDGEPVDIVLNPLGVPSRMNIGQILETHLGWAVKGIGNKLNQMIEQQTKVEKFREYLTSVYQEMAGQPLDFSGLTDAELVNLVETDMRKGIPVATPVFDGAVESDIKNLLRLAELPENGQTYLYDGRTGRRFDRPITVGYMYMLKLNHLVDEKMHARSTGSYALVTQQPLGGKAQQGGQRFGEMEVWALEAYGAAYTLQEILTVKSDDVDGRGTIFKNIVAGDFHHEAGVPESFKVLAREVKSLGLDFDF